MGRIFNSDIQINGMPCHKYILRKLSTVVDAATFSKTYVNTMLVAGATYEEIEASLPLLSLRLESSSPIAGFDFSESTNEVGGLSLVDSIRLDESVPTYKKCDQFYRKFDSKKCACLLCPLSAKYLNTNFDNEKALIMFALSSSASYEYVRDKGVLPEHFKSVFDLLGYFTFGDRPCCYPLFSKTYSALMDEAVRNDFFNREDPVSFGEELLLFHDAAISNGYMPKGTMSAELMMQLSEVLADEVVPREELVGLDVDALIMYVLNPELVPKQAEPGVSSDGFVMDSPQEPITANDDNALGGRTVIAESSNMGADSINNLYDKPPVKKRKKRKKKRKAVISEQIEIIVDSHSKDSDAELSDEVILDVQEITLDDIISYDDEVVPGGSSGADECPSEEMYSPSITRMADTGEVVDAEVVSVLPGKTTHSYAAADEIKVEEICNLSEDAGRVYYEISDAGMVGLPIVEEPELHHFALCLDDENIRMLAMFESYVIKDKRLSMELIKTDSDKTYLLFFVPRLRAYFYTDLASEVVREIVVPLLTAGGVSKYCYYPFATLSALWKMGIYVTGVYSLFSMGAVLFGNHNMDMSAALQRMGATEAVGGVTIKPEGGIRSVALMYMHCYPSLYHRGRQELTKKGYVAEYDDRNAFDVLLGYSYYQNRCVKDSAVLFTLTGANKYRFLNTVSAVKKGKLMRYSFDDIPISSADIVRGVLCKLASLGRFKQYGIMITEITGRYFTVYVRPEFCRNVATVVNTTILSFLKEHELHGLTFYYSEL